VHVAHEEGGKGIETSGKGGRGTIVRGLDPTYTGEKSTRVRVRSPRWGGDSSTRPVKKQRSLVTLHWAQKIGQGAKISTKSPLKNEEMSSLGNKRVTTSCLDSRAKVKERRGSGKWTLLGDRTATGGARGKACKTHNAATGKKIENVRRSSPKTGLAQKAASTDLVAS